MSTEPEHEGYGTFFCHGCYRLYEFRWDGQMWRITLLERREPSTAERQEP